MDPRRAALRAELALSAQIAASGDDVVPRAVAIRDGRHSVTLFAQLPDAPQMRAEGLRHVSAILTALDASALIWSGEMIEPQALLALALSATDARGLVVMLDGKRRPAGDEQ